MNLSFLKGKIARKLILALILFSSVITLVITAIQIAWDFRGEVRNIHNNLSDIEATSLQSISQALWVLDDLQLKTQLEGLLEKRDVSYLGVVVNGEIKIQVGMKAGKNEISREFPIQYEHRGELQQIGVLQARADLTNVYWRLLEKLGVILLSNLIKTLLVAAFLFLVIHRLVTGNLEKLSVFAVSLGKNLKIPPLSLGKNNLTEVDEMDDVQDALNRMQADLIRTQEELIANNAYRELLLDSAYVSIIGVDTDGIIQFANQATLKALGYQHEGEVIQADLHKLVHHQHQGIQEDEGGSCPIQMYLHNASPIQIQNDAFHRRDGTRIDVEYWIYPIIQEGENKGAVISFLDVTSQRETARLKEEFISTISHELRTPLTSIMGSLGILNGMYATDLSEDMKEILDISTRNTDQLIRLINDLLDIQKMESGKFSLDVKEIHLYSLLEYAVRINQGFAEKHSVKLELEQKEIDGVVDGDWDRLIQVMSNLMSNAIKFSPENSRVVVSMEKRGSNLRVSVKDQGSGIPEAFYSRIFQKFTQADSRETRKVGGTGLGLNISKAIVEAHGGKIGFKSKIDVGTDFFFDLPMVQDSTELLSGNRAG